MCVFVIGIIDFFGGLEIIDAPFQLPGVRVHREASKAKCVMSVDRRRASEEERMTMLMLLAPFSLMGCERGLGQWWRCVGGRGGRFQTS